MGEECRQKGVSVFLGCERERGKKEFEEGKKGEGGVSGRGE